VKKFAVIALSLGFMGVLPAAQATPVTVDAGTFTLTYDSSYLAGSSFSFDGGVFSFTGALANVSASAAGTPESYAGGSFNGWNGGVYPILLTPKAGYQIAGVAEAVSGIYSIDGGVAGGSGGAVVLGGFVSNWLLLDGVYTLGQNVQGNMFTALAGQVQGESAFKVGGAVDFSAAMSSLKLSPGAVVLSSIDFSFGALASGAGASASGTAEQYQLSVKTSMVPEPESLGLLLAGLGVVGFKLSRRQQR
jgi:hypothetical protein